MIILGVDPGYDRVGIAVIDTANQKEILLHSDCIQTDKKDDYSKRILTIGKACEKIIKTYSPEKLSIESLFLHKNQKTAMRVSEARGVVLYIAARCGLSIHEYTPIEIKEVVAGFGRADKKQVHFMVEKRILLPKKERLDDEIDAVAVALCCAYKTNQSLST